MPKKLKADNYEVAFMKDQKINYMKRTYGSARLRKKASEVMPSGVTASIKHFEPYIDYCFCLGPLVLGHGHPTVVEAIKKQ